MHSGYVALVGRPNVGKSTLMNALLGEKISIVSSRPQTTRNRISGILSSEQGQIVFVDTPGIHAGRGELNKYMVEVALRSLGDVDVVAVLVDAARTPGAADEEIITRAFASGRPVVLILNKVDAIDKAALLPLIDRLRSLGEYADILPLSALTGDGIERLPEVLLRLLPEHPPFFPTDQLTEVPERFIAAELIREKLFELLREEIPYSTAVEIEKFDESDPTIIRVAAIVIVERDSQKGIVIGKGGKMLKEVGTRARLDLEKLLATRVFLEIFVKVVPHWTRNASDLKRFGYE